MSGDNDAFDRAVRALRETGEPTPADVARTRRRILETMHRGERRGRRTFWLVFPIAAVLAGSTALAQNSEFGRRIFQRVAETIGLESPTEKPATARKPRGLEPSAAAPPPANDETSGPAMDPPVDPAPLAAPADTAPLAPLAALPLVPADNAGSAVPRSGKRLDGVNGEGAMVRSSPRGSAPRASAPPPSNPPPPLREPETPAAAAVDDGEAASLQLYKRAYRLHFVEQNYAAALSAWDAYLRTAPTGRLVVEARYNRAIALVRLGRQSDAEAALGPFARGEVSGGYRAREARELLDVLNTSGR